MTGSQSLSFSLLGRAKTRRSVSDFELSEDRLYSITVIMTLGELIPLSLGPPSVKTEFIPLISQAHVRIKWISLRTVQARRRHREGAPSLPTFSFLLPTLKCFQGSACVSRPPSPLSKMSERTSLHIIFPFLLTFRKFWERPLDIF